MLVDGVRPILLDQAAWRLVSAGQVGLKTDTQ
jgi:hypothetical protein